MNPRLLAYLRSLGLSKDATEAQAWEFQSGLRGLQRSISNCLNYVEEDQQARTNCDLQIRALGHNPDDPAKILDAEPAGHRTQPQPQQPAAGGDGASTGGDLEAAERRGAERESQRRAGIEQYATIAGCSEDFTRGLIDDGVTIEQARERIFEDHQSRTRASVQPDLPSGAPAQHSRNSVTGFDVDTLSAAFMFGRGLDPATQMATNENGTPRVRKVNDELERKIEAAYQYRAASLEDMIRMCARLDNVNLPVGRTGILQSYLRAGVSTAALSAVFTTNVNSELLAAYQVAEDSTGGGWVRESDVSDFRTNERARMANGGALKKLTRGGTADHADFEDVVESFKIARYAKQFVIDEQDVVDDNFGGIAGFVPADLGVAARQVRPDLIYTILMGNPDMRDSTALFHADHGNLTGSSALAAATLATVRKKMRIQTENGRNLNIMPKFLIVPPALEDTAEALVKDRTLITGADTTIPSLNTNATKGLVIVSDARLENGLADPTDGTGATTNAGSATTWFMSAVAASHTIECAYLRGSGRVPQIRPFVLDRGQWGLGWDVKMDVGAKALDWRGLAKATSS